MANLESMQLHGKNTTKLHVQISYIQQMLSTHRQSFSKVTNYEKIQQSEVYKEYHNNYRNPNRKTTTKATKIPKDA